MNETDRAQDDRAQRLSAGAGVASASEVPTPSAARGGQAASLWRNRDYMLLWAGQVASILGSASVSKIYPLLILAITGSAAQAGVAAALQALPYLVFSLPAGALIDRWDRKRVMILCDLGRGLAVSSIALAIGLDALSIWHIYAVALVNGSLFVFFNIAEAAVLPKVVPAAQLPNAVGQNEAAFGAAMIVGPSVGTSLFQLVNHLAPFVLNAVLFFVSLVSLRHIRTSFRTTQVESRKSLRGEIVEGLRWILDRPLIRYLALLCGGMNMMIAATPLLLIMSAKQLGAQDMEIGVLFSVGGLGGILGSMLAARLLRRFGFRTLIVRSVVLIALIFPLYAVAPATWLLALLFGCIYMTYTVYSVVQYSYRLTLIPDALQGRVNSSFRLVAFGFDPLGALLSGLIIEYWGVAYAVGFISVLVTFIAVTAAINRPLRELPPIQDST